MLNCTRLEHVGVERAITVLPSKPESLQSPSFEESQLSSHRCERLWVVCTGWLLIVGQIKMLSLHSPAQLWSGQVFSNFSRNTSVLVERKLSCLWWDLASSYMIVLLHQIQSIGKGDLQEQEEGGGSGFMTENKQLGLWWLRGQHGHLLSGHQGSEVWCLGRVLKGTRMNPQVCRNAGSKW